LALADIRHAIVGFDALPHPALLECCGGKSSAQTFPETSKYLLWILLLAGLDVFAKDRALVAVARVPLLYFMAGAALPI
jgi:hypothetical protein